MAHFLSQLPDLQIAIKADRVDEFLRAKHGQRVDLVILDIALPNGSGVDVLIRIKKMLRCLAF